MKESKSFLPFFSRLFVHQSYLSKWIVFILDLFCVVIAFSIAYMICYSLLEEPVILLSFVKKVLLNTAVTGFFLLVFNVNRGIIRYSTFSDMFRILWALICSNLALWFINEMLRHFFNLMIFPDVGFLINFTLAFSFLFFFKMLAKFAYDYIKRTRQKKIPVLIYGITPIDVELAYFIRKSEHSVYKLIGFVSPTSDGVDKKIYGVRVFSDDGFLDHLIKSLGVRALVINPVELDRGEKQKISDICLANDVMLLSAPSLSEWNTNPDITTKIRKIRIEDLLGRIPIEIDVTSIAKSLNEKCILVTGAAGSIGSEVVRQICKFNPDLLLLCDEAETPIHQLSLELEEKYPHIQYLPLVSDVRNKKGIAAIFEKYKPQFVYHAAAYKHVPLMEEYPCEAVLTNVLGTKNMVDLSIEHKVESFVMISTDKAVNPSNIMGCSKRIAEIYVQSISVGGDKTFGVRFITTRFGNVLGSSGSVIPLFQSQIEKGGPVTVTHKDIIRYFMTIPEACRLVLEAGNMGKGGEIFVFDMGDPVKISDLAERMIRLSGLEPGKDIQIKYTGLRPGEKLYEELLNDEERTQPTYNRKIKIRKVREYDDYEEIHKNINTLIQSAQNFNDTEVVQLMKVLVPEFISMNSKYESLNNPSN